MKNILKQGSVHILSLLIGYFIGFIYFGNLAVFNIWQSAFSNNEEVLPTLTFRFWLFGFLSLTCLFAFIVQITAKIKETNREYRKSDGRDNE